MFNKNGKEYDQEKIIELTIRNLEAAIHLYEYSHSLLMLTSSNASISTLLLADYATIYLYQILGMAPDKINKIRVVLEREHDQIINNLSQGKKVDPTPLSGKFEESKEELKRLGINFDLQMGDYFTNKEKEDSKSPTKDPTMPKLTKAQIDKIISDNADKALDEYLRKKKERENGSHGSQSTQS